MFEVGKKYKNNYSKLIWDCLWADHKFAVLRSGQGSPGTWIQSDYSYFEEYKGPVVEKVIRQVHQDKLGSYIYIGPNGGEQSTTYKGSIQITLTDGKLTNVEIV